MRIGRVVAALSALALGVVFPAVPDSSPHFAAASGAGIGVAAEAMPQVGVLMDAEGEHWCTASVVHSKDGNLVLTAAHCLDDSDTDTYFVPGFHDGERPYGTWQVVAQHADDDADVAFLVLDRPVEPATGGFRLAFTAPAAVEVRLIGYPDALDAPITCENATAEVDGWQRIDCTDFSDGTSGSPWLTSANELVGIIGGYQDGGYDPDVSYSPTLGTTVFALYEQVAG